MQRMKVKIALAIIYQLVYTNNNINKLCFQSQKVLFYDVF
jgi:hypothetical protein